MLPLLATLEPLCTLLVLGEGLVRGFSHDWWLCCHGREEKEEGEVMVGDDGRGG